MKTCPFCAEEIQDQAVVCKHCGRDLKGGASQVQLVQPKKGGIGCFGAFAIAAFVGLALLAGFCVMTMIHVQEARDKAAATDATAPPSSTPTTSRAAAKKKAGPDGPSLEQFTRTLAGERCGRVTRSFFMGHGQGKDFWSVSCSAGPDWSVMVEEGKTTLLECSVLKAVARVECFKPMQ